MAKETTTNYIFPKEYFRLINRFMKEVGLYPEWMKFLYTPSKINGYKDFNGRYTEWEGSSRKYSAVNVLGATNFTYFLKEYCRKPLPDDICSYALFAVFLFHFYPAYLEEDDYPCLKNASPYLHIDKENKIVKILWEKK